MKRCPSCQRTYTDDALTFCLDDGSTLLSVDSSSYDAPPTMRIPEPRVTNQPPIQPPAQPPSYQPQHVPPPAAAYGQPNPAGTGFKLNNRVLGIAGASLVIISVIMPLVSLMGILGFSYLQIAQLRGEFFTAYLIPLLGGLALYMAIKNQFKPLIGIGVAVLAIVIIDYFRIRSTVASFAAGLPGARPGAAADPMAAQYLSSMLQISMGFFALVAGSVLLIVAGAMKDKTSPNSVDWHSNPPPPPMNFR